MGIVSSIASSVRKRFFDAFSVRSDTTGSLGTATDGSAWDAVNGTIEVKTGAAKSTTIPSAGAAGTAYPMSIVTLPQQDARIELDGTNEGSAIAIWVQSSSDWWMVNVEGTQVTNTNYAQAAYWSYNYAYSYATASVWNTAYNYNYYYTYYVPSYWADTWWNTFYSTTAGPTSYYVTTASGTPYTSAGAAPFTSSTPYTSALGTSYTANTPYYRQGFTVNYTKGTTTYTRSATTYTKGTTTYTSSGTSYTSGATTYYLIPPGTYSSLIPYTSSSYGVGYTAWTTGAPYNPTTAVGTNFVPSSQYFVTNGPNAGYTTAQNYYTYIAGYTTNYSEFLKIKQSVASTVSEISSALISTAQTIKSLIVSTSGNVITAKAYSDNNFVTQVGSDLVYTATGATVNTKYGISVSPSAYNQSDIIGTSINITRN